MGTQRGCGRGGMMVRWGWALGCVAALSGALDVRGQNGVGQGAGAAGASASPRTERVRLGAAIEGGASEAELWRGEALNREIQTVLSDPRFVWRMPRDAIVHAPDRGVLSWARRALADVLRGGREWVEDVFQRHILPWLRRMGEPGAETGAAEFGAEWVDWIFWGTVVMLGAIGLGLIAAIIQMVRRRPRETPAVEGGEVDATAADLDRPEVDAGERPSSEWEVLAGQLAQKGEWRTAVRAMHLAALAHLGDAELIRLSRGKSDRDYLAELERRNPERRTMESFGENVREFERIWWGWREVSQRTFDRFAANLERLKRVEGRGGVEGWRGGGVEGSL